MTQFKPKFSVGDIVYFKNNFNFNPASKVATIGKVESIHVHTGKGLFVDSNEVGKILYTVSGHNCIVKEDKLKLYEGEV